MSNTTNCNHKGNKIPYMTPNVSGRFKYDLHWYCEDCGVLTSQDNGSLPKTLKEAGYEPRR